MLRPCPFCGSDAVVIHPDALGFGARSGELAFAHCDGCGADGPPGDEVGDATIRWNVRMPPRFGVKLRAASRRLRSFALGDFP